MIFKFFKLWDRLVILLSLSCIGVQELIYHSTEFQFAAAMLQKVNDRYKDIMIKKEDVAFIVKIDC